MFWIYLYIHIINNKYYIKIYIFSKYYTFFSYLSYICNIIISLKTFLLKINTYYLHEY